MKKKPSQAKRFSGPRSEFGKKLRERRLLLELTIVDLAVMCETDSSYIGRIERGEINPGFDALEKILKALQINIVSAVFK